MTRTFCDVCGRECNEPTKVEAWVWKNWESGEQESVTLDMCFSCSIAYKNKMRDFSADFIKHRREQAGGPFA